MQLLEFNAPLCARPASCLHASMIPLALLTRRSPSPAQAPAQARAVDPPAHHSQHAQASSTLSRMARLPPQASNVPGEPYFCQAGYFKNKWIKYASPPAQR